MDLKRKKKKKMGKGLYQIPIFAVLFSYVLCCTKLEPGARATGRDGDDEYDKDERKVYYSQVVVWGEVVANATGNYPFKDIPGVYTVKFNVICTYKGGPVPSTIYIAGVGNLNKELPSCPSAPLGESKNHVMFLKKTSRPEVFEIEFKPNQGDASVILDDLSIVCGLNLSDVDYHDTMCGDFPPMSKKHGCAEWTPLVIEPTTPEPKSTPPVKKSGSTNKVIDIENNDNQSDQSYNTKTEDNSKTGSKTGQVKDDNGKGDGTAVIASLVLVLTITILTVLV